ncbi:protein AAR2 homolog [Hydra vulgaris]|uniref:Protein AAR2 homolog n=1 Tax=Hydra vulgaris TaxID=6087 RepID=T2M2Y5_HYDVU|nr:protein AAR2 homolog [Hydra vulgaris]
MFSGFSLSDKGCLIMDNVPPGTEVGIDYHSWYTGTQFKGISNIPPGFHMLFFSATDKYGNGASRTSYFLFVKKSALLYRKYDKQLEDLIDNQSEESNLPSIEEVAKYLAPYPLEQCAKWPQHTNYINDDLLQRVQPLLKKLDALTEVSLQTSAVRKKKVFNLDSRIVHKECEEGLIRFSKIPDTFPLSTTPAEKTLHCIDSTYFLKQFINSLPKGEDDILGELQFAFICFLLGQVYDAFDHWKALINLIASCQNYLSENHEFFCKFIDIVERQLEEIPEDFFVDIVAQNNFLVKTFKNFFTNFDNPEQINNKLLHRASIFKGKIIERFHWDLDYEDEEDLPVVVDI